MIECSTPFHAKFLFFFSSHVTAECGATLTSSCAVLLLYAQLFSSSSSWAALYCWKRNPAVGSITHIESVSFFIRYLHFLFLNKGAKEEEGTTFHPRKFTVDWPVVAAAKRICYTQPTR